MKTAVVKAHNVEWTSLPPGTSLKVAIEPHTPPAYDRHAADARWAQLCLENPRYHDGQILAVLAVTGNTISCRPGSFRELAVQPNVQTGCEILAVTAVVTAIGADREPRLLLGKRHTQTRVYGGLWELGPSGGVPPPRTGDAQPDEQRLLRQLAAELNEEAGLSLADAEVTLLGFAHDLEAFSLDTVYKVAMRVPLENLVPAERDWEYPQIRWITPEEGFELAVHCPESLIPPTRLLLERPLLLRL